MEDMGTMDVQDVGGTGDMITCETCRETKPRSQYRQVDSPTKCKTCIAEARAQKHKKRIDAEVAKQVQQQQGNPQQQKPVGSNKKKRVSVYLEIFELSILNFLSAKGSQSATVEKLLKNHYQTLDPQVQDMVRYMHEQGIM